MTQSDWPLFEVFVKSRNGLEHKHASSLHATDAAHALCLARDVYTRRQEGKSLWVIPSACIAQQGTSNHQAGPMQSFEVFLQLKAGLEHKQVGSVQAQHSAGALEAAEQAFGSYPAGAMWVTPAAAILASQPEERPLFLIRWKISITVSQLFTPCLMLSIICKERTYDAVTI